MIWRIIETIELETIIALATTTYIVDLPSFFATPSLTNVLNYILTWIWFSRFISIRGPWLPCRLFIHDNFFGSLGIYMSLLEMNLDSLNTFQPMTNLNNGLSLHSCVKSGMLGRFTQLPKSLEINVCNLSRWEHESWDLPLHTMSQTLSPKYDMTVIFGEETWNMCLAIGSKKN